MMKRLLPGWLQGKMVARLERAGFFQAHRTPPIDFRGMLNDPLEALRRSAGRPVLIDVPLSLCRSLLPVSFPCTRDSGHPLIETALGILEGTVTSNAGSPLQQYFQRFQPANLAELMGLTDKHSCLATRLSPYAFVFPWIGTPGGKTMRRRLGRIHSENKAHHAKMAGKHGWVTCGPVSPEKANLEYSRLASLLAAIQRNGYQRTDDRDGDICGIVLVGDDGYVIGISPGQHRVACLVALGYEMAPVRIGHTRTHIVRRNEVKSWPAARDGFYSPEQALEVFDRVYAGRQPFPL